MSSAKERPLILASASPQRLTLLRRLGVPFRVVPGRASENTRERDPRRMVKELALRKARAVAALHPRARVLGADTVVFCRGKIIVKPRDRTDSERIIRTLSGVWQQVYTGVALVLDGGRTEWVGCAVSRVLARRLSEAQIASLAGKHMDKAGGYAVQDRSDPFIARVVGDRDNVIGFPLRVVRRLLRQASRRADNVRPKRRSRSPSELPSSRDPAAPRLREDRTGPDPSGCRPG